MRKNLKLSKLIIMSITIIFLIGISNINYAIEFPASGFYVNGRDENVYFDVYTFLNNERECMEVINSAGLRNTIFIHQSGNANTLQEILQEYNFRDLEELAFEDIYRVLFTDLEINTGFDVFRVIDIY